MESVRADGRPVLRIYRWSPPCLSLGRNQPALGQYDQRALAEAGIDIVRRPTGGRAVLHDHELTYSVVISAGSLGSPRAAYTAINRALVSGLRSLGVDVEVQPSNPVPVPVPSLAPCFRDPAEGEVVARGRKLVGSAQCREKGTVLQHGSLLLSGDQRRVTDYLAADQHRDQEAPAVLMDLLPSIPSWEELRTAVLHGWHTVLGARPIPEELTSLESDRAAALTRRYSDPAWTWRL